MRILDHTKALAMSECLSVCVRLYVCMHVRMHVCMYACMHTSKYLVMQHAFSNVEWYAVPFRRRAWEQWSARSVVHVTGQLKTVAYSFKGVSSRLFYLKPSESLIRLLQLLLLINRFLISYRGIGYIQALEGRLQVESLNFIIAEIPKRSCCTVSYSSQNSSFPSIKCSSK